MEARIYKKLEGARPVMIAGWPGMGSVALGMVDYLRRNLKTIKVAEIMLDRAAALEAVTVEKGVAKLPGPPRNIFYYAKEENLLIFVGEAQATGQDAAELLNKVLDTACGYRAPMIYTGAAFPLPVTHKDAPEVYGVANSDRLKPLLKNYGLKLMEDGHISGLNGMLLGFARERRMDAACLLATMPQYAIGLPNPKASCVIIETLKRILSFDIDLGGLKEYTKDMDERMAVIEERVKDVFTVEDEEPESMPTEKKIPGYIMEKIEKLFHEARSDKAKAIMLKKELDRWDLYKLYEDRFLDLFRESQ